MFRGTNTVSKASHGARILQKTKSTRAGLPPLSSPQLTKGNGLKLVSPEYVTKETKRTPSNQAAPSPQTTGAVPTRESQVQRDRQLSTTNDPMHRANTNLQRSMIEHSLFHFEVGLAWVEIGTIYAERNDPQRAYEAYRRAVKCTQGCQRANDTLHIPLAHQGIGILHFNKGGVTKAMTRLHLAIQRIKESEVQYGQSHQTVVATAKIQSSLGTVLMYKHDYSGALHELTKALEAQQRMLGPRSKHVSSTQNLIATLHQQRAINNGMSGEKVIKSQIAAPVYSDKASLTSLSRTDDKGVAVKSADSGYVTLKSLSHSGSHLSNADTTRWFQADDDASYDTTDDCLCSGPLDIVACVLHSIIAWVGGVDK